LAVLVAPAPVGPILAAPVERLATPSHLLLLNPALNLGLEK